MLYPNDKLIFGDLHKVLNVDAIGYIIEFYKSTIARMENANSDAVHSSIIIRIDSKH